jgi:hypothetical protein
MGYYMDQMDQKFFVAAEHIPAMVKAIHALASRHELMGGASYQNGEIVSRHYSWVNNDFVDCYDVKELFRKWRWSIELKNENIVSIFFEGDKMGDDEVLLRAIAPYVEAGSYIEMRGEDYSTYTFLGSAGLYQHMWRWCFDGKTMVEKYPTITW